MRCAKTSAGSCSSQSGLMSPASRSGCVRRRSSLGLAHPRAGRRTCAPCSSPGRRVRWRCVSSSGDARAGVDRSTLPDAHVRRLVFTDYVLDDEPTARKERATTFMHEQVERMCDLVDADPNLSNGFDVLAFGQGGLVARGYVQRCNNPRVRIRHLQHTQAGWRHKARSFWLWR